MIRCLKSAAALPRYLIRAGSRLPRTMARWVRGRVFPAPDELDRRLLWWTPADPFTVRDLLNGGVSIVGRAGSGKTSSSGRALAAAVVGDPRSGGLILAAKPEDRALWEGLFAAAGRAGDLRVFGPDQPLRLNFLDYVLKSGGHTRDVTRCLATIAETLLAADSRGGEGADFWEREQERMIANAVEVLWLARGNVTAPDIQQFLTTAAADPAELAAAEWQDGFHNQCLRAAFLQEKSAIAAHDFRLAMDYWAGEYPNMADKMRSSILTGVMGLLHAFNTGVVRELVSTTTTVSPDDLLAGTWVLVDMAPAEWGDLGSLVAAGWKFLTQRRVLRRAAGDGDPIHVIWVDEAQQFVNGYDAHYLAQCRSHRGCMVYLTQSLHSYYAALKGQAGRHQADALLTNFHHKLFHAVGDVQTAEWAAGLVGKTRETFVGTSVGPVENIWDEMMGRAKVTTSTSEHYEPVLQTNAFMTGLRTGGRANGYIADAILIRSGEPFSTGENWLPVAFSQTG
ncbi:type IV secretory system conjugative DNA transfer family protein [Fimbriiglobus ruber]|uniref:TraD/TraG TraM recognition site domain-containing protein n=1 Tax=Fimbriiglobus ruber TaxID=1908690 RepID=A0A225DXD2_9BACT|nr:TraM recognition domain-containing protein [Fimbriiglobus ruber]OWK40995.1 hypothetical protein FRUB_04887 [Fimbriiglobus ruber]